MKVHTGHVTTELYHKIFHNYFHWVFFFLIFISQRHYSRRSLKREARSLALLQSATLPRCLSAGRSRSSENSGQYSTGYGSDDLAKWKANSCNSGRSIKKIIPDYKKSHEMLARELDFRKKQNLTTTARPFIFSTDNLLSTEKVG